MPSQPASKHSILKVIPVSIHNLVLLIELKTIPFHHYLTYRKTRSNNDHIATGKDKANKISRTASKISANSR